MRENRALLMRYGGYWMRFDTFGFECWFGSVGLAGGSSITITSYFKWNKLIIIDWHFIWDANTMKLVLNWAPSSSERRNLSKQFENLNRFEKKTMKLNNFLAFKTCWKYDIPSQNILKLNSIIYSTVEPKSKQTQMTATEAHANRVRIRM